MSKGCKFYLGAMLLFLAGAFVLPCSAQYISGYAELTDSEATKAFRTHVSYLASAALEGRKAGSEGEKAAAVYVRDVFKEYGVELLSGTDGDLFGIASENGDTLRSRNVAGFVQGCDKTLNDRYIVVGARLDNLGTHTVDVDGSPVTRTYYGANGNASGLAMLLEVAKMVKTNSVMFRRSVIFIAFGSSSQSFAGAWYFLNRSFGDAANIDAMINLDMVGTGSNGFYAYTSSNPDMNMILSQVAEELQPVIPTLTSEEPWPSDHRAFYSREIPSVLFTTGKYPEHNTVKDTESIIEYDYMDRETEYVYNFVRYISNLDNPPLFRQNSIKSKVGDKLYDFTDCDRRPSFMGSADPKSFLFKWVYQYLKYPKAAVANGIQGRVIVGFTVNKDGSVSDVQIVRSADQLLDDEALRIVKASPKWKPGTLKGEKVNVSMTVAIDFKLTKQGKFGIKK